MKIEQVGEGYRVSIECGGETIPLWSILVDLEREIIARALEMFDGSKAQAADYLQLNRTTLVEKAKKYGFPTKKRPEPVEDLSQ